MQGDHVQAVTATRPHVFCQADFVGVDHVCQADDSEMLLHNLLPKSQAWESWIFGIFSEIQRRQCSVTVTGLPKEFRWDYGKVKKWVLTLRSNLPIGHRGVVAFKAKWDDINRNTGAQEFSGHMWVMWSNSVLAKRACDIMSGQGITPGMPCVCEIASQGFCFTASKRLVDAPKYGHHVWHDVQA